MSNTETVKKKMEQMKYTLTTLTDDAQMSEAELVEINVTLSDFQVQTDDCNKQIAKLEDELDATESKLQTHSERLAITEKKLEEDRQAFKLLKERRIRDREHIKKMENELADLNQRNMELAEKIDHRCKQNSAIEMEIDVEEERATKLKQQDKDLEIRLSNIASALRMLEISENETSGRNTIKEQKIANITVSIKEVNERATKLENETAESVREMEEQEDELAKVREEYHRSKNEVDGLVLEIWEM